MLRASTGSPPIVDHCDHLEDDEQDNDDERDERNPEDEQLRDDEAEQQHPEGWLERREVLPEGDAFVEVRSEVRAGVHVHGDNDLHFFSCGRGRILGGAKYPNDTVNGRNVKLCDI